MYELEFTHEAKKRFEKLRKNERTGMGNAMNNICKDPFFGKCAETQGKTRSIISISNRPI